MYELSRVRLYSIGPAGARYADTVLDLRGVGAPVPDPAPIQAEFFEEEPVGPRRRPAPAGVLFLENGGGKSVLLKLIFSVMLPGHRNTLGGASSGVLRKFLLADDCGHVALEWQHTLTGECVVVGKVSEWRGRQVSNDPRKFAEAWYSFRPGPGLSLDNLPVAESTAVRPPAEGQSGAQGRRRTMKGFRDSLTEAGKAYPHLEVHWEEIHDRWIEHLGDLGLDPELFRYQREMNADEGEAAGLFAVKKDSDFTDLLLRAVTDTRDTDGLADLVGGFGNKLGRRSELIAERDFTAGSVDLLGRIVDAAEARARARDIHAGAERRTRTQARRLSARAVRERMRATDLAQRVTAAAYAVTHSEGARERSALIAAELAYRHASLALAAAEKSATAQKRELADARTLHSAWQAAETVLRHRAAADRVARVSAAIQEAERDAAPALAARAKAAADLVRALHTAARSAEALANEGEERSAALQEAGEAAHRDSTAAATEAQRARSEAGHLRQRLTEVEQETAEAVRAGWLDDSAPDADPARAALAASDAEKTAVAAWDTAREAARRATEHAREAASAESRAELTAARAADAATAARRTHDAERRLAETLAAEERLAELLSLTDGPARLVPQPRHENGTGPADPAPGAALTPEDLDRYADELRELLDNAVSAAERHLFELRTAAADDARILGALGDGGLLPPGPDVLATVEYLGELGIPALPGWRYLAQAVDPVDHARVLAARPELVDGVIITDPGSHARAREALADAALLPRSAVAVGTAAALLAPTPADNATPGDVFLVPPNPAMHDEHAADEERQALRVRATERDEEIRALAARLAKDRDIAARLASWRTGCPAGRLTELARAAAEARAFADESEADLAEARTAHAEAAEAAAEALQVRDERQEAAQRARRSADALAGLAFRLRERSAWQARLRELADEAAESEARAQSCLERARAADEDRRAAQRAADDARRTARALRAERSEIAGAPDDVPDTGPDAAKASLPALREAYRAASQVYEKVGVGADLRAEQARAESDESAARAELDRLSNKVRTRAEHLLASPDGADGPSRQAAAARAEELVQLLETRMSTASEQLGRLRGEAERHAPADGEAHTELPEELLPRHAEHAQALLRTATSELASRTEALAQAREAHAGLLDAHRGAEDAAGGFDETAAMLRDLLREHLADDEQEEPEPYPGSIEEARHSAAEARRSLRGCAADLSAAESAVREAGDVLVRHANSSRYEQVRTPARQQIRELPASALPEHARKWADAFAPRLRVLTDELAQLERNRDSIVDRLRGLVESALATLRSAQRLSRLPEGLGEWSGQEFLRIRFEEPDQATLTERLGEVIDEATRAAVKKNSDLRRDGMSLLLRGVAAALQPKGIAVEILKPDAVLRAERVPVGQMGDVFSGGQLLTAAIALYCTMAALRSNDRGRERHRHAGTLFLDNPIGRANATYLLELQRAVSDALGVQLLYTTGLFDTTALAEFPLVIRLRNDADLRAGLKYISVEEHLRPGLPQQTQAGEAVHSEITATRMFKRPTSTSG
ncbi:coiled-coil domain-containing protein [Streptomyces sp. YIM S03343]